MFALCKSDSKNRTPVPFTMRGPFFWPRHYAFCVRDIDLTSGLVWLTAMLQLQHASTLQPPIQCHVAQALRQSFFHLFPSFKTCPGLDLDMLIYRDMCCTVSIFHGFLPQMPLLQHDLVPVSQAKPLGNEIFQFS